MVASSTIRFSTLKNRFPQGHLELAHGDNIENRNYVFKIGEKWENHEKSETRIPDTQEEYGELPIEHQGYRIDLNGLYDQIKEGKSAYQKLEDNTAYIKHFDKIERVRQMIKEEQYKEVTIELFHCRE